MRGRRRRRGWGVRGLRGRRGVPARGLCCGRVPYHQPSLLTWSGCRTWMLLATTTSSWPTSRARRWRRRCTSRASPRPRTTPRRPRASPTSSTRGSSTGMDGYSRTGFQEVQTSQASCCSPSGSPSASEQPSHPPSCWSWSTPSRRTTTWWARRGNSLPRRSAWPRLR